ncbi:ewing's tumor-associated antigen 1 [Mixophyes fleayi]|uniref:ewing's tumor-associated antigen 1 n=1 Tax=Mixophyes fleayi TaxID=3061075 RepID=UPI003F4DC8B0
MTSRRRQPAHRSRQIAEEEETAAAARERRASKEGAQHLDRETPNKTKAIKKLRRSERSGATRLLSPTSSSVPPRSERDEELCSDKTTPQRLSKCKPWTSAVNSPSNDAEQQQEIFWDPHSPAPFKLDNGKRKQAASKCTVDISDIVNRIAPKDEKPANSDAAYLGVWIGDDAIPCTPVVSRPRTKMKRSRILRTEEELMKLAKQLDRNLIEHRDQHVEVLIDSADAVINMGTLKNSEDDSFLEDIPEEDDILLELQSVSQSSNIDALPKNSSQKSVDQDAEAALNAIFDSSTQKYSGRLSQGLSDVSTSSLLEVPVDARTCIEKDSLHNKVQQSYEKNTNSNLCSSITRLNANVCSKQNIAKEKETFPSSDMVQSVSSSQDDFEDDWGTDILDDDSFMMQITQNPSLIATPKNNLHPDKPCHTNLDVAGGKVTAKSTATSSTSNKFNPFHSVPRKVNEGDGKANDLRRTEMTNGRNVAKSFSATKLHMSPKSPINLGAQMTKNSNINLARETFPSNMCELSKSSSLTNNFSLKSSTFQEGKNQPVKKSVSQTHAVSVNKDAVQHDEWNDPKFSDEVLDMFCESDSLWEGKEDDDDLLYQVCDDVERLTQIQVTDEGNRKKENVLVASSSSKMFTKTGVNASVSSELNKNVTHVTAIAPCVSNKFRGNAEHLIKTGNKGVSPATVSGNCSNSYQTSSFLRTNQTSLMFQRSNSVPSEVVCKKPMLNESRSQTLIKPQTATSNAAPSKYSFTRIKPSQVTSAPTKHSVTGNESSFSLQDVSESKTIRSTLMQSSTRPSQQPLLKRHLSESTFQSSKVCVSEDRNKKCSMEEIERKKQEALARRKMRVRACSNDSAPT